MKLKDKVVLITDGASPTGLAIAERFKAEGAILCLNVSRDILVSAASLSEGIDKALAVRRAAAIATLLASSSTEALDSGTGILVHANPVVKEEVDSGVAAVLDKYGRIDVVVHNNNEVIRATLEDCSDEAFDMTMEINAKSAFLFAQAAAAPMKQAAKGNFVFISSIHDEKPSGAAFAYSLAKGALKMLVKEMVLDLGPHNIRANIVNMGPMEGHEELFSGSVSPLYEHTKERISNMRLCTLEEVANAALFFASDDCPSATGASLSLDGGFLLSYFSGRKRK